MDRHIDHDAPASHLPLPVVPANRRDAPRAHRAKTHKPDVQAPPDLYAALDLGTNACRMLIAQPTGSQFRVVDSFSRAVQLGHSLKKSGRLSQASMARAAEALRICQRKLSLHNVKNARLVATEACRRASNTAELVKIVERDTGLRFEIIKPEEEARLAVMACAPLVLPATNHLLVIDIGGGSTELVWLDLCEVPHRNRARSIMALHAGFDACAKGLAGPRVVDWISIPLGVTTLCDQFSDVADTAARFALMSWYFEEKLAGFSAYENATAHPREGFQIIGTSGTMTNIAAMHLGLKRYDRNKVDGLRMTSAQIDRVVWNYLSTGARKTAARKNAVRHNLIVSGFAILQALLRNWPTNRLSVADRGLSEGLLYAQMSRDGVLDNGPFRDAGQP